MLSSTAPSVSFAQQLPLNTLSSISRASQVSVSERMTLLMPPAMVSSIYCMSDRRKLVFLMSDLNVKYLKEWQPNKHEALTQCYFNFGPTSKTAGQHYNNIGSTSRVCWECICEGMVTFLCNMHNCLTHSINL